MDFLHKIDQNPHPELFWNFPEQKLGAVSVIGGNLQNFRTPVKITETISTDYPVETANLVLPDALKTKLPPLPNLVFLSSTDSGSFASGEELSGAIDSSDYTLLIGDLSKNSITEQAIFDACMQATHPILITRDAVDLVASAATDRLLLKENLVFLASMPQMIKLFRAVYYPKMLLLSQPLLQVAEALHKFTLSYPVKLITLHNNQILVAEHGDVNIIPLENTTYSPLNLWLGDLAAKIAITNLYNPNNFLNSTTAAIFGQK